jgi:hypothetical protein
MSIMVRPIITLTTDFGLRDSYVAEMKGVILGICPDARIVDVSHEVEKFNIRMGTFILACAAPSFPKGTIHVAVVDPGVGTKRKPILIQTRQAYFIGPDNGILILAAKKQGIEHVYEITNRKLIRPEVSNTFHGRDIFAPTAAHLAKGTAASQFGRHAKRLSTPDFVKAKIKEDRLIGEVIHVDDFGNIITNLDWEVVRPLCTEKVIIVKLKNKEVKSKLCKTYGEAEKQKPFAIVGSHGFLEFSVNQGNAAETLDAKQGDKIVFCGSSTK